MCKVLFVFAPGGSVGSWVVAGVFGKGRVVLGALTW